MAEALISLIQKKRATIVSKWFDSTVQAYPHDTAVFLKSQKDQFANPVGSSTRQGIETLMDQLVGEMAPDAIKAGLDPIMRIRAVQSLSPARATAFIFALKQILRELFRKELQEADMARQFFDLEARIDRFALDGFDIYMGCRERVLDLKANEMRNRTFRAFKRAGLVAEGTDNEPKE
ncbi:MAG: RsbRD N-terminal domain-containing protein [Desulfobacterales bacterium]|nr:RsbRD N-terminal domain-containing protein [Desulfobacterales bacterium]